MSTSQVLDAPRPAGTALSPDGTRPAISAEMTEITPETARAWMERHREVVEAEKAAHDGTARDNRPVRYRDVAALARDMRTGKWVLNGESIKISRTGTVIDGQHRLYACMQAEVPFASLVVTGVEPEAQDTIDTGSRRSLADQLAIANEKNAAVLATVTRWLFLWQRHEVSLGARGARFSPTQLEMLEFLAAAPELREAAAFAVHARMQLPRGGLTAKNFPEPK